MEYEFYLDLFFLYGSSSWILSLYLASCLGRIPVRVPGFLAAAAGSVCNCILAVFLSPSGSSRAFSGGSRDRKPHELAGLFLLGSLESS